MLLCRDKFCSKESMSNQQLAGIDERLTVIKKNLNLLREQQDALEREAILTTGLAKIQASQRLKIDIKPPMKNYEEEYWEILLKKSEFIEIPDQEAQIVVAEIVKEVNGIDVSQSIYPDELKVLLLEIQNRLNQLDTTASAKLKGVISSIPPFIGISYEAELDTEKVLRQHIPTFMNWTDKIFKKKLP